MKKRDIINKIIENGNCNNISCVGKTLINIGEPCPLVKINHDHDEAVVLAQKWLIDNPEKKKRDIINKIIEDGNCKAIDCDGKIHYAANFGKKCPLAKSCDTTYVLERAKEWLIDHPPKE